jgi:hypothetical protein
MFQRKKQSVEKVSQISLIAQTMITAASYLSVFEDAVAHYISRNISASDYVSILWCLFP